MKPRAADPRSTQPGAGKTGAGRTDRTAGTDRTARTARAARTTSPPEPQDAPVKGPLQRDSFGSHLARAMVLLLAFVCMVGFAVALAKATLVPSPASVDLVHTNLRPGQSLRTYLDQPAFRDTVKQIGGNVLLGAPFGVLLPVLVPKARGALRVVVVTALVMVAVEAAQGLIVEGRAFDIDDVILNTTGALLGYVVIGRRLGRALHPRRRHWWHRWTQRPPAA
ncbi:VanZ family protein [Streptomyces hygroscopicus]|uniref:VanZ family protein n=1 Tax=Streptomyces hygroscopicus TaxID=1912 RepID=UPI001F5BB801|nr:VanZ family protein [Streptomyces sp. NBRC 109436]